MTYLQSSYHLQRRKSPADLLPGTKSVIVLGLPYPLHPLERLKDMSIGLVSGYAIGEDYHQRIPNMLAALVGYLREQLRPNSRVEVYSDSAPILERELAVRAGLGWIGKNSSLVNPTAGSAVLLAEIFIEYQLEPDAPYEEDRCGTCQRCIQACPTGCILPNRTIDARRCLSYHTIENRGSVPEEIMSKQGNWVFGCDICQMVCPWNRHSVDSDRPLQLTVYQMKEMVKLPFSIIAERFPNSAIQRAKPNVFLRSLLIALVNTDALQVSELQRSIDHEEDPGLQNLIDWVTHKK